MGDFGSPIVYVSSDRRSLVERSAGLVEEFHGSARGGYYLQQAGSLFLADGGQGPDFGVVGGSE